MTTVRAAVFASGTGSNFSAIMDQKDLACDVVLLVCDQPHAAVIEKAKHLGVETFVFDPKDFSSREAYERVLIKELQQAGVTWIFLAGYMRIVGQTLLRAYDRNIVNIHPSLLPSFPGVDAIGQAFRSRVKITGVTVHYIDEGIDTGPIIAQEAVAVLPEDTLADLQTKIQAVEHELYPRVINQLISRQVEQR